MANNERLREVLNTVAIAHVNGQHDQKLWGESREGCGTTFCVAGWATVVAGHRSDIVWISDYKNEQRSYCERVIVNGRDRLIDGFAGEWLELTQEEATSLFYDAETYEDVQRVGKEILDGNHDRAAFIADISERGYE